MGVIRADGRIEPGLAMQARKLTANATGYEGGRASRLRRDMRDGRAPDVIAREGALNLRNYARALERNHDLARGALKVLVRNIVGANGITVEPMPRRIDGTVHNEFADQIMRLRRAWMRRPEVTGAMTWPMSERFLCRVWLRDGEVFAQQLQGTVAGLQHGTVLPYSLELLEPDFVPLDYDVPARRIVQGIEKNAWGRKVGVYCYKQHPAEMGFGLASEYKRVPAERMLHAALKDRLHQTRGITLFCASVNGLADMKDTSDYELAAAKVASSITGSIYRDPEAQRQPGLGDDDEDGEERAPLLRLEAGLIFDGARAGEKVEIYDAKRPNTSLEPFLDFQGRKFAAGIDASASSITRNYNGTYSSQRQELVESDGSYRILRGEFVGFVSMPAYEGGIAMGLASGLLQLPRDIDPYTIFDAEYYGPPMPWIAPVHEAEAELINVRAGFKSLTQVVRERSGNPWQTLDQIKEERRYTGENKIVLDSDAAAVSGAGVIQPKDRASSSPKFE